jgi:hypothetical protein
MLRAMLMLMAPPLIAATDATPLFFAIDATPLTPAMPLDAGCHAIIFRRHFSRHTPLLDAAAIFS